MHTHRASGSNPTPLTEMVDEPERIISQGIKSLSKTALEPTTEIAETMDAWTTALNDSQKTTAVKPIQIAPPPENDSMIINRTELTAMIKTEVDRQVEVKIAELVMIATEETLIGTMQFRQSANDLGNNTPMTNLIDNATVRAVDKDLLYSSLEAGLNDHAGSNHFFDAIV